MTRLPYDRENYLFYQFANNFSALLLLDYKVYYLEIYFINLLRVQNWIDVENVQEPI